MFATKTNTRQRPEECLPPPKPGTTYWFVCPEATAEAQLTGISQGDGTFDNPWDLQTAMSHPACVKPGDTIWLF